AADGSLELRDNAEVGTVPTQKVDFGPLVVNASGNNFGNAPMIVSIVGTVLAVPDKAVGETLTIQLPSGTATVESVTGLKQGQKVIISKAGGGVISFMKTGNLFIGDQRDLIGSSDRLVLAGGASGSVVLLAFAPNSVVS
ncbi:hypothetical protein, partial [Ancylobacter oerskovii]